MDTLASVYIGLAHSSVQERLDGSTTLTGVVRTTHVTPSEHGGVVRLPLQCVPLPSQREEEEEEEEE
jgi:hypothetical protein